jgi:DNA modification methylase
MTVVGSPPVADEDVARKFAAADWSLTSASGRTGEFHPYPARYIPALPNQVMDLIGISSGTVLDPFCGSGTTLAEARRRGLHAVGVDINPIACLISRVRTSEWMPSDGAALKEHVRALRECAEAGEALGDEFSDIPRLDHWFEPHAQRALTAAIRYVRSIPQSDPWHDRVAAAVSAATVRISRQDSDTRYAAVDKAGDQRSVATALERSLTKTGTWLASHNAGMPSGSARVINSDARELSAIDDASISLACFSPPYPNAYEYWLYHKYRMYWLGFDAVQVRTAEIGARPHYSKKNGLTEDDFALQMGDVFRELRRVLVPDSMAVAVIGDSVIGGRVIDNGELLCDVARDQGLTTAFAGVRDIATAKSSFNRAHSRGRRTEHVLVFRSPR